MQEANEQTRHIEIHHKNDGSWYKPSTTDFNIMTWNINRMTNKMDDLENYIISFDGLIHVIIIVETYLNPSTISEIRLENYTPYHNFRTDVGGGGVTMFVHNTMNHESPPEVLLNVVTPDLNHFLSLKLRDMTLTGVYRRPAGQKSTFINELDEYCLSRNNHVICGDFNIDLLVPNDNNASNYIETIMANGFHILNEVNAESATRQASRTILDHVLTDKLDKSFKMAMVHSSRSDHCLIILGLSNSSSSTEHNITRKKVDLPAVIREIEGQSLDYLDGNQLNEMIATAISNNTTETNVRSNFRLRKAYITCEILKLIRLRDTLCALKYLHPDNEILIVLYRQTCGQVRRAINQSKSEYYDGKFTSAAGSERKKWQLYNEIIFNKTTNGAEKIKVSVDGNNLIDSTVSANIINERFANAGLILERAIIDQYGSDLDDIEHLYPQFADRNWNFDPVSTRDIESVIDSLPSNKAPGTDNIPTSLLKSMKTELAPVITSCVNESILTGEFPSDLAVGRLKLIHKKGDNDVDNFRGIVVTKALSKVYEKTYVNQLNAYLSEIGFFQGAQYGFQAASNTTGAAFQVINYLMSNKRKFSGCIFIDMKRAFETINHVRLAAKLKRTGLSTNAVNLMTSFLKRRIVTNYNGFDSAPLDVMTGIGQGTILGPVHFIIYMQDMLDLHLHGTLTLYADDAALTYAYDDHDQLQKAMQEDLRVIQKWLVVNLLTLNVSKTEYMLLGRAQNSSDFDLEIDGQQIARTRSFKYLGLQIEPNLSFNNHVNMIRRKIGPFIGTMWRCQRFIPQKSKKQIYFAFVASHLQQMMTIWGPVIDKNKTKQLRTLQNRAVKALHGLPRATSTTYLYSKSILPVEILIDYEQILNIQKMRHRKTKHQFVLDTNAESGIRTTRQSHQIRPQIEHQLLTTNIDKYNKLEQGLMDLSLPKFKDATKTNLVNGSDEFYLISPFYYLN